jgi:hypothetical protein
MKMQGTPLFFVETQAVAFLCSNPLSNLSQEVDSHHDHAIEGIL